ncbi:hypothetical protein, partial [Deinococcus rubellus]|uniref:hypothetical protein n=1 Tax=Deinococcus rubellus TaxID=1889240 RepID=UPI0031E65E35
MWNSGAQPLRAELLRFIDPKLNSAFDQEPGSYWTSSTGSNLKSWQAEGYGACGVIVQNTKPRFIETRWGYADRVLVQLEALKTF